MVHFVCTFSNDGFNSCFFAKCDRHNACFKIACHTNNYSVYLRNAEAVDYSYDKVKSVGDVVNFLSQFGWTVNGATAESAEVTIPAEFDKIFASYNEIQKRQGLDLTRYAGRKVMRYTYKLTNWQDSGKEVYATVIVYKNRVIGGDLCSPGRDGFVLTLEGK